MKLFNWLFQRKPKAMTLEEACPLDNLLSVDYRTENAIRESRIGQPVREIARLVKLNPKRFFVADTSTWAPHGASSGLLYLVDKETKVGGCAWYRPSDYKNEKPLVRKILPNGASDEYAYTPDWITEHEIFWLRDQLEPFFRGRRERHQHLKQLRKQRVIDRRFKQSRQAVIDIYFPNGEPE